MQDLRTRVTFDLLELQNKRNRLDGRLNEKFLVSPLLRATSIPHAAEKFPDPFRVYVVRDIDG